MGSTEELRARALESLLRGDTAGAITDLKQVVAEAPDDERAWLELGTAYASIDHHADASAALAKAVELDGGRVDARLAYARALVRIGKPDEAAFQLLQATKLEPVDARVMRELGIVFYDKKLYEKAALWLGRAHAAAPNDARATYALGLTREAQRDIAGAIVCYRDAIRADPGLADARSTLADALASIGEHEQAITELEAILRIDRKDEQAAHNREVLLHALAEMHARRLLGKDESALAESALVQEGHFQRKGPVSLGIFGEQSGLVEAEKYGAPMVALYAATDADRHLAAFVLVLTHPERAAQTKDEVYKVTVIGQDGSQAPAPFATAVSVTFLRETLGCPMTHASEIYARLLSGTPVVEWGDAAVRFTTFARPDKPSEQEHGILVRAARR